jgi:flagellin-like protein
MRVVRSNQKAVSPVIAVILLVAITTVLAAVVYVTVSSIIGDTEVTPYTILSKQSSNSTTTVIKITGIQSVNRLHDFIAVLIINGTMDDQSTMRPIEAGKVGNLTFVDLGDEKLSIGDSFRVNTVPGTRYQLAILYFTTGNESGSVEWQT